MRTIDPDQVLVQETERRQQQDCAGKYPKKSTKSTETDPDLDGSESSAQEGEAFILKILNTASGLEPVASLL